MTVEENCSICKGKADETFKRIEVWSNERWRLTMSTYKSVRGFCYLEPKRHIPYVTDLDGIEAQEFGVIMASVTSAIKLATAAKLIYVYIYGGHIPHLHIHLAPHTDGDFFVDDVIRNDAKFDKTIMNAQDSMLLKNKIREKLS